MRSTDSPLRPWIGAVTWRHFPRASGSGLGPELRPVFGWLGCLEVTEAYDFAEHRHACFEVILVRKGRYRCRLDGQQLKLEAGEALVISPGQLHQDFLAPPLSYLGLSFHLEGTTDLFREGVPVKERVVRDRVLLETVAALEIEAGTDDQVAARVQDALLSAFFWRLVRALPAQAISSTVVARLDAEALPVRLARAIEANLEQPLRLKELARVLCMSPRGLTAACRRHGLPSPMAQVAEMRLQQARALLAGGGRDVKQVAQQTGFANPFHFSRAFRRRFGLPPSALADMSDS